MIKIIWTYSWYWNEASYDTGGTGGNGGVPGSTSNYKPNEHAAGAAAGAAEEGLEGATNRVDQEESGGIQETEAPVVGEYLQASLPES